MSSPPNYRGYRFPPEIISHTLWFYHRFTLSLRDVEEVLAKRGVIVSYETIRQWCAHFGPLYANKPRKRQGRAGDVWNLEVVNIVIIGGQRRYLWRAVDQDGDVIDTLVQRRKDKHAAKRLFKKLLKGEDASPNLMVTDKLPSYSAAKREMMPSVVHCQNRYPNRVEVSHEPTGEQERQMRRFKSPGHAQRFLAVHGRVQNLFRLGRHLLRASHYRVFRGKAFDTWQQVTYA